MNKLILIVLLCMYSAGLDAHKSGLQDCRMQAGQEHMPESTEFLNPFLVFWN